MGTTIVRVAYVSAAAHGAQGQGSAVAATMCAGLWLCLARGVSWGTGAPCVCVWGGGGGVLGKVEIECGARPGASLVRLVGRGRGLARLACLTLSLSEFN